MGNKLPIFATARAAVLDTYTATTRLAVVSWLFVVFLAIEILCWSRIQDRLLANAERTEQSAQPRPS